ncbi:MAG: M48 family metalloprotease [Armatimonadetes bacterium]|nr:M48 family metalloprotease [Armatimonadota bacterium]
MRTPPAWSLAALALCGLTFAASVPPAFAQNTPPALSDKDKHQADEESKQGAEVADEVAKQMKLVTDPKVLDRVNTIGQRLAAVANSTVIPAGFGNDHVYPFKWTFHVVQDKNVNAFSLPGGYVYVNSGLLDMVRSDDELAGVLAHEITHAAHHHVAALSHAESKMSTETFIALIAAVLAHVPTDTIAKGATFGQYAQMGEINNKYSEAAERDADHGGTIIMQKAGYNPVGMLTFMERLADIEKRSPDIELGILRDHPYTTERVGLIRAQLAQMKVPITFHAVRTVSGGFRASVQPGTVAQTQRIVFNNQTVATLADPDGTRARASVEMLNDLLDKGLQLYQVEARDGTVYAADRPVLTITPADAALSPGATADSLAAQASQTIRNGLYAQSFVVSQPSL